jgi:hypothetical protein
MWNIPTILVASQQMIKYVHVKSNPALPCQNRIKGEKYTSPQKTGLKFKEGNSNTSESRSEVLCKF